MRRYETFVILDPDLSEDGRLPVIDRIKETIAKQDGFLVEVDEWGGRKLAYEIKKKSRGYYNRLDYCGSGQLVNELERFFRIDDRVLKYMTVLLDESADLEKIKEEIAQAEALKAEKAKPQPDAAAESKSAEAPAEETSASESPASEKTPSEKKAEASAVETETATSTSETGANEATKEEG